MTDIRKSADLQAVLRRLGLERSSPWSSAEPVREELFGVERLEDHARSLAHAQATASGPTRGLSLTARLSDNEAILRKAFRTTIHAVKADIAITPAAEWLIDNFHLVERQIREIRADLPPGYYRQLPKLVGGPFAGYPRVFGVAWAYVAHTDSRFDPDLLCRYVCAYQEVQPLTTGELWAVAITLRVVLIENLRRFAVLIEQSQSDRSEADRLADRLLGLDADGVPEPAAKVLADRLRDPVPDDFSVQFVHRLQDQNPGVAPALTWLDERLAEAGTSTHAATSRVHDRQVSATVTVRNIISSMRLISEIDWLAFFERMSPVHDLLSTGALYLAMDFPTRNLYRTAIEDLARSSPLSELEIAAAALRAASFAKVADGATDRRRVDPGYYLLAAGRPTLEATIGYRTPVRHWAQRLSRAVGIQGYGAVILVVAAAILLVPLLALSGAAGSAWLILLAALGAIPALDAAVGLVNAAVMRSVGATFMPALELRDGVPAELRTLVGVPVLITSLAGVAEQIEGLEIHHLASLEGDVHFALLSDWADAPTETVAGDDALLTAATAGIAELNSRYPAPPGGDRFVLLHRRRVWNASQQSWIGWERKRGKLHELNQLLRGATGTNFITADGSAATAPRDVRFVITLDADTKLPRDTVRRLIGKLAHPLNRPRFDAKIGRVVEGHGVLQPRITPSLPTGHEGSLFQRIYSSHGGIDPYAAAVSDVYQDLFGEGSYAGKGIYDVDAFEAALAGRVQDSTLLSHDLFEGVFARAGLASDVEVVEEFPDRYDVASRRHHRWARGDWQLLKWIVWPGRGPNSAVPMTGRFKMIDNLRRSLTAPMCVLALFTGWTILPLPAAALWTGFLLLVMAAPALIPFFDGLLRWPTLGDVRARIQALGDELRLASARWALTIVFLADQAWVMSDAIARTLVRLTITRRHLLQWTPAAQLATDLTLGFAAFYRGMAGALLIGALGVGVAWYWGSGTWPLALAFGLLWTTSPAIAIRISTSPPRPDRLTVIPDDARTMRQIARQTWRFFEFVVTKADNMLPPDNFQEVPAPAIAHRTSPTNIGVYLLSVVAARDFGWLGTVEAVERLEATFATLDRMARFRGHFYNWYDTRDCRVLDPQYVSSVDSGNLAGHLMTLAVACREWRDAASGTAARLAGVGDALDLARAECVRCGKGDTAAYFHLETAIDKLSTLLRTTNGRATTDWAGVKALAKSAEDALSETPGDADADLRFWIGAAGATVDSHIGDLGADANVMAARLAMLEAVARKTALEMDFAFLLDADRKLLSIGFSVADGTLDANCYDLLASEARLASYFAIAKGDVPARHWFRLGHAVTPVRGGPVLISWSGSMFEYLMPALIMRPPAGSLLERTECRIVSRQIDYGLQLGTPWGISESAYNARDLELTYQYSNFGVPGLGLKRGLGDDMVVAPYATALAAMVQPHAALRNFEALEASGGRGRYGFYEALDYTPSRLLKGNHVAIVRNFMAHHQGMTILALANTVLGGIMRDRFHAEPMIRAAELLLQERMPRQIAETFPSVAEEGRLAGQVKEIELPAGRHFADADTPVPATHLLSNGRYTVMLTAAGSGFSRWRDLAVTRWREDATCDDWGAYVFLRDCGDGSVWSAGFQPTGLEPDTYGVTFNEDRAEFVRRDGNLTTTMAVLVSAEDDSEARRISVANAGTEARVIEITSYAELALAPQAADLAHPVFSKLFVETQHLDSGALLAHRRRRDPAEADIWAAHLVVIDGNAIGSAEFETDRAQFIGRGGSARRPRAIIDGRSLSGSTGTVLDPVFALRTRVLIAPGATAHVTFWTMIAASRQAVLDLIDKHRAVTDFQRAATLAWTQAQVQLHHLRLSAGDANQFQRLAGRMLYVAQGLRPASETIAAGAGPQSGLWSLGISGDLPIVVLRIADVEHLGVARDLVQATDYWRMKRLAFDLVIINERGTSYIQDLQNALEGLVRASQSRAQFGERAGGGAYVLRADLVPDTTRALLLSVARVVLDAQYGRLASQLDARREPPLPRRLPRRRDHAVVHPPTVAREPGYEFFNGVGGFADDGREYVVTLGPGQTTPVPWINVIANAGFGFQVSADGAGFTWAANSREHPLTPWSNDPVQDSSGHAFYIRDDDSGALFGPTAAPIRDPGGTYVARHGWGYSRFGHAVSDLELDLLEYVPRADPVRISRLTIRNTSDRARRLTVAAYVAWVLGPSRGAAAPFTVTSIDPATGALFATNRWYPAFADRTAFLDLGGLQTSCTGDRREFIGRNGELDDPAALAGRSPFSNRVGAGFDPCGALQTQIELAAGASIELVCLLGETDSADAARMLIERYRVTDLDAVLDDVKRDWESVLGVVQVRTPDRSLDIMLNGWLLYQTLACRVWARSAFYQASGAYGFRDQLQDVAALLTARPDLARAQLLRAAGRQFVEGDVQHWWLPQTGNGVRTRFADDRVWLALVAADYLSVTGDTPVLDETVAFLDGPALAPGEAENFFQPTSSGQSASLYEHCARALDASLAVGSHGLPLFGGGDWNDGMNRVGIEGRGESVWMGWFLHVALTAFVPVAAARGDAPRAAVWAAHSTALATALDAEAWDGAWYRRGWFDDGSPLGSSASTECRIDSLAQSWAVIAGAGDPERARRAMAAAERELVSPETGLALLFTPPFDQTPHDPGYIKGYPPGIRENGGQYTHAALWSVIAHARLGEGDKAAALLAMLNPINHSLTPSEMHRYKVEPYVVAADVYSRPPHVGRGGWTWYTGAAGWMQRAGIEDILGLRIEGVWLRLDPCIPRHWPGFELTLHHGGAVYEFAVENPDGVCRGVARADCDGVALAVRPLRIAVRGDGKTCKIRVRLG